MIGSGSLSGEDGAREFMVDHDELGLGSDGGAGGGGHGECDAGGGVVGAAELG